MPVIPQCTPVAAAQPPRLSSKMILPFVESTRKVLATMLKVESTVLPPRLKDSPVASHDVSGIIGFGGEIVGSVVLTFQRATARKLVEAFAGADLDPTCPDFADAIGELANMIVGSAKKDLGLKAVITVPTVIIGAGHIIARLSGVPCIVIPCTTPWGDFAVEVNIKPVVPAAAAA